MQHILTKQNGNVFLSVLLALVLLLPGCSLGESHDLYYALPNGYFISRINSKQITIAWDQNWESDPNSMSGVTTIDKYFIKGFCHNERFIGLLGTHTQLDYATEDEIETDEFQYYVVDTENQVIYGPLDTQLEYDDMLQELNCEGLDNWLKTKDYPHKWKNHYREEEAA